MSAAFAFWVLSFSGSGQLNVGADYKGKWIDQDRKLKSIGARFMDWLELKSALMVL